MIQFTCKGHENMLGLHRNTLEFTKDKDLTLQGDCIIGVDSNFDSEEIKKILKYGKIKIIISTDNYQDEIIAKINKDFNDKHEIVIRTTDFNSKRTLGINANKAAKDINRELIKELKNPKTILKVEIGNIIS